MLSVRSCIITVVIYFPVPCSLFKKGSVLLCQPKQLYYLYSKNKRLMRILNDLCFLPGEYNIEHFLRRVKLQPMNYVYCISGLLVTITLICFTKSIQPNVSNVITAPEKLFLAYKKPHSSTPSLTPSLPPLFSLPMSQFSYTF